MLKLVTLYLIKPCSFWRYIPTTPSVGSPPEEQDILEFLDTTGYAFLGSVSLTISTYKSAFSENTNLTLPAPELEETLSEFAYQHFSAYFEHMQSRYVT